VLSDLSFANAEVLFNAQATASASRLMTSANAVTTTVFRGATREFTGEIDTCEFTGEIVSQRLDAL
jgi:hypothetical protein